MRVQRIETEWVARELARRSFYGACRLTFWTVAGIPVQWAVSVRG